jgi:hypothetical protein
MAQLEEENEKRAAFLVCLSETGNISEAAAHAGVPRRTVYNWRKTDEDFAREWDEAVEMGVDALEDEATRRAKDGCERPVFYKGEECGYVREYSDTLMVTLLKARRPDKFKDRVASEVSGPSGAPQVSEVVFVHHKPAPPDGPPAGGDGPDLAGQGPGEIEPAPGPESGDGFDGEVHPGPGGYAVG